MTNRVDAMSIENGTSVNVHVFDARFYHRAGLFLRFEQI